VVTPVVAHRTGASAVREVIVKELDDRHFVALAHPATCRAKPA
jgi:hypothetical protein